MYNNYSGFKIYLKSKKKLFLKDAPKKQYTLSILNRYIMVERRSNFPSRNVNKILSQEYNFFANTRDISVNYTQNTFVPLHMCLHKTGVSFTWTKHHDFHLEAYFFKDNTLAAQQ
jgi:hypothetical protein